MGEVLLPKRTVKKKSLIVYVYNNGYRGSWDVHPVKGIANGTKFPKVLNDETRPAIICEKFLRKAGCPKVGEGETQRVRVTIEPM